MKRKKDPDFVVRSLAAFMVFVIAIGVSALLAKLLYDSNPRDYSQAFVFAVFAILALLLCFIGFKLTQYWMR